MKVVLSWLREFAPFPDDVDVLVDALANLGLPVEELAADRRRRRRGGHARVLRTEAHPDAAKVQRVWVDAGDGAERHVWCGAFNFEAGDVVPFAPVGTALPDGRVLTSRAILGIPSEGMLCSAHELGLGSDHSGIMVLPETATVGVPYGDVIGLVADVVFDLDVTRNRPDCHGHLGVARDLAAWLDLPFARARADDGGQRARAPRAGRHRRRRFVRPLHHRRAVGRTRGPERAVDGDPAARGRSAPDQQRGRREQLRHARAATSRTTPTTSTPWAAAASGCATPRRGSASPPSTASTACSPTPTCSSVTPTTCRSGWPGSWAAPTPRSPTPRPPWRSNARGSSRTGSPPRWRGPACAATPRHGSSAASTPTASTAASPASSSCSARRAPSWWCTPERSTPAPRALPARERQLRRPRRQRQPHPRHRPRGRDDLARLLDPIGYTVDGDGAVVDVALPSWRPDSTEEIDVIEEVGRHYGYANIVDAGAAVAAARSPERCASSAADACARCWSASVRRR